MGCNGLLPVIVYCFWIIRTTGGVCLQLFKGVARHYYLLVWQLDDKYIRSNDNFKKKNKLEKNDHGWLLSANDCQAEANLTALWLPAGYSAHAGTKKRKRIAGCLFLLNFLCSSCKAGHLVQCVESSNLALQELAICQVHLVRSWQNLQTIIRWKSKFLKLDSNWS